MLLSAGNLIPADGLVIEAEDFLVTEASLTGESFPVEKRPGIVEPEASLSARTNAVFLGTSVRSGTARLAVVPAWDDDVPLAEHLPFFPGSQVQITIPAQEADAR